MNYLRQLENRIRALQVAPGRLPRALYHTLKMLWHSRMVFNSSRRSVMLTRLWASQRAHQLENFTRPNRYPDVFLCCAHYFSTQVASQILSFGCATGEEVFTLRQYFPLAHLTGVDINRHNIRVARASPDRDVRMTFCLELPAATQYDAIFCMAVLQRTENRRPDTRDSSRIYPFARFDAQLSALDAQLKVGGLLVVDNADYRFEDASVACRYQPLASAPRIQRPRPVFDRNNQRSDMPYLNARVFKKVAAG